MHKHHDGKVKTWAALLSSRPKATARTSIKVRLEDRSGQGPSVRWCARDKSGTTHIFKAFLLQVNTEELPMEAFHEVAGEKPCPESEQLNEGTPRTFEEGLRRL